MIELLISIFFAYKNAQLAKLKGFKTVGWGVATIAAFFLAYLLGGAVFISLIYKGALEQKAIVNYILNNPLVPIIMLLIGVGGCLLVRYILEKKDAVDK